MKAILIATVIFLILLGSTKVQAKVDGTADIDFQERISVMVREHKVMTQNLIAYMEYKRESINLMAEVIYWENWYMDADKRAAYLTGAVVMNRVKRDDAWLHLNGEKTVKGVLYARGQYSTTKYFFTKEIPQECYDWPRQDSQ